MVNFENLQYGRTNQMSGNLTAAEGKEGVYLLENRSRTFTGAGAAGLYIFVGRKPIDDGGTTSTARGGNTGNLSVVKGAKVDAGSFDRGDTTLDSNFALVVDPANGKKAYDSTLGETSVDANKTLTYTANGEQDVIISVNVASDGDVSVIYAQGVNVVRE